MSSKDIKKILVAVDFREEAVVAARAAFELARALGAETTVLHAYHPWGDVFDPPGFRERMRPALLAKLEELVRDLGGGDLNVQTALEEGRPAKTVSEFAERWRFDLVMIGAGAGRNPFLGSVAERVVRTCSVPVLVVPLEETPEGKAGGS